MEETKMETKIESQIALDDNSKAYLKESGRWMRFFGLLSVVAAVLFVCIALYLLSMHSIFFRHVRQFLTVFFVVMSLLMVVPIRYMLKSSSALESAFRENDPNQLSKGLLYMKSFNKYLGWISIVVLSVSTASFLYSYIADFF